MPKIVNLVRQDQIKLVEQRNTSDCSICCVAMLCGWEYERVEKVAYELGYYDPDNLIGVRPHDLVSKMFKEAPWDLYSVIKERFQYFPCIASIDSINMTKKDGTPFKHAALLIYKRNEIHLLDPSTKKKVTLPYVFENAKLTEAIFYD